MEGVLIGTAAQFLMFVVRKRRYVSSWKKMVMIYLLVTSVTIIGAPIGSVLSGGPILGMRLYGSILLSILMMWLFPRMFNTEEGRLGDYVCIPIIAGCAASKIPCISKGCCYGIVLFTSNTGESVQFPSQIVEVCIWVLLTVWLCAVERKGAIKSLLWPVAAIWFGIFRFLVDFMRGNPKEMQLVILGLPGGRFWSLVVALMGIVMLFFSIRKYYATASPLRGMMKAIVGMAPTKVENQES